MLWKQKSLFKSHLNFFVFTTLFSYAWLRHFRRARVSWSVHETRVRVLHLVKQDEREKASDAKYVAEAQKKMQ